LPASEWVVRDLLGREPRADRREEVEVLCPQMPADSNQSATFWRASAEMANDSGDGSNPGIVR